MPTSQPVEVIDVRKRYRNGPWANDGITLGAVQGEILGIVGPNGAGKTTLIRQITTELRPTSGAIRVFGIDAVARPQEVKRLIGVMPQEAALYWGLSVQHHLRIFARLRGLPWRDAARRCDELIADLGLEEHRHKTTETLSGGLRRRVLLGIAAVADSPLLILDEPSVGQDPEARRDLWGLLRSYRNRGKTVLLSTHYMEQAPLLLRLLGHMLRSDSSASLHEFSGFGSRGRFVLIDVPILAPVVCVCVPYSGGRS